MALIARCDQCQKEEEVDPDRTRPKGWMTVEDDIEPLLCSWACCAAFAQRQAV